MSVVDQLKTQIQLGEITFDPPAATSDRLRKELLGENAGTTVTTLLQQLVLEISKLKSIRISSIIRNEGHHGTGRAFDVGNEDIAAGLLPQVATDAKVDALKIDEIIFDAAVASQNDRNMWNYDNGQKHPFDAATLDQHKNHIHFAVKAS
jgi:hypothetical protein